MAVDSCGGPLSRQEGIIRISGNTRGLKAQQLKRLERLAGKRSRTNALIAPELARPLTELSHELNRQVGLLIDRRGQVREVVVGDARSIFLPDLSAYRQGRDRLCGLRLVHTHLHDEGLDQDDLTDLALLRLDVVAAIRVQGDGLPGLVHAANLLPANTESEPWDDWDPISVYDLPEDFSELIAALEAEFARGRRPRKAGDHRDRAMLVHVSTMNRTVAEESLDELRELARSAGIEVLDMSVQRRQPDPKSVVGKGRLQTMLINAMQLGAEMLIFDMNLSPAQVKNLADITDLKVLDRTQVILDIFAQRAQTREGKIQVELAQLRYMLPFLSTKHTALSRLTGGIGGRGPGETKLEIDRRRAQDRIAQLQREVDTLGKRRRLRRDRRMSRDLPTISIVGYTNAGKSTLLNRLTQSDVVAEDALFATLNPVSRRLRFPQEREVIITDTVGFIRDLPPELLDAFRTTFEEIAPADLLLHVLDASSPEIDERSATVNRWLAELEYNDKDTLVVLNKADRCDPERLAGLTRRFDGVAISALDRETFGPLIEAIEARLFGVATANASSRPFDDDNKPHVGQRDAI